MRTAIRRHARDRPPSNPAIERPVKVTGLRSDGAVYFVGPLPPPMHGFSAINAQMLDALQARTSVRVFDRAPSAAAGTPRRLAGALSLWLRFAAGLARRKPSALYVGLSGGSGQWLDLPFLAAARWRGVPIYAHHHSFAYVLRSTAASRCVMRVLSRSMHVVLCEAMAIELGRRYAIDARRVLALSNAAFVEPTVPLAQSSTRATQGGPLRIGFLSNISAEKGIFDFFAVTAELSARGLPFEACVAGPVDERIRARFDEALRGQPAVRHVGAVYGDAKHAFFHGIDVLLFPTRYVNEAEPVTVLEALASGVTVLAARRGCIDALLGDGAGEVVGIDDFHASAIEALNQFIADRSSLQLAQHCCTERFETLRGRHRAVLLELVECVARGAELSPRASV